jgi:hypothetical protein
MYTPYLFLLIALVSGGFSAWDYKRNSGQWSTRAKIWVRLAVIFGVIAIYLLFTEHWQN